MHRVEREDKGREQRHGLDVKERHDEEVERHAGGHVQDEVGNMVALGPELIEGVVYRVGGRSKRPVDYGGPLGVRGGQGLGREEVARYVSCVAYACVVPDESEVADDEPVAEAVEVGNEDDGDYERDV